MRHRRFHVRSAVVTTVVGFVFAAFATHSLLAQTAKQDAADTEELIKVLDIRAGSSVGEIGAGGGELSVALAKVVGQSGHIFSNELNADRREALRKTFAAAGLTQVTVVEGRERETNFSDACCDAIFMRSVYHHFADPAAMNASLLRSLKPGGRLAVIDFSPDGPEAPTPSRRAEAGSHGVTAPTVARELTEAGFEVVSSTTSDHRIMIVALKRKAL
jgi:ubiquinone/menaquinone biosynthesis C-methylase UbiE